MSKKIDKILELFLEDPYRKYNIREAARMMRISPMTASKHLNNLFREEVLKKERDRNFVLYFADTESDKFKDMKICYNIERIRSSGLVGYMERELNYPEVIILFGSYSKGENSKNSDIDIFILSENKQKINISPFEKKLGAKLQIFLHNKRDLDKMKLKNKELLNNIINGLKLSGFFEVF